MVQPIPPVRPVGPIAVKARPDLGPYVEEQYPVRGLPPTDSRLYLAGQFLAALLASGRVGDRDRAVDLSVEWADRLIERLGR